MVWHTTHKRLRHSPVCQPLQPTHPVLHIQVPRNHKAHFGRLKIKYACSFVSHAHAPGSTWCTTNVVTASAQAHGMGTNALDSPAPDDIYLPVRLIAYPWRNSQHPCLRSTPPHTLHAPALCPVQLLAGEHHRETRTSPVGHALLGRQPLRLLPIGPLVLVLLPLRLQIRRHERRRAMLRALRGRMRRRAAGRLGALRRASLQRSAGMLSWRLWSLHSSWQWSCAIAWHVPLPSTPLQWHGSRGTL